jgi:small subunit ribosomal protein S20
LANLKSAKKRVRRNAKAAERNRVHRVKARSYVRKARVALEAGDLEEARERVNEAAKWLDHAASKGVIHANNAGRRKGRLQAALAELEAEA